MPNPTITPYAALRDGEDAAQARAALAELDAARRDFIRSEHSAEAGKVMMARIEAAQAAVNNALADLLRTIDYLAAR